MEHFKHLLHPVSVRGYTFKHRITASPTGTSQVRMRDGKVPEDELITLRKKVAGGFSLVEIGETPVDGEFAKKVGWCAHTDFSRLDTPQFEGWKRYCEAAHGGDNLAFVQIFHCGDSRRRADGGPLEAYGPDEFIAEDGIVCHAMDEEMMATVCDRFAQAAWYLKQVGFDGVELHAAHGWLFSQFLSPLTNHRKDQYGGSIENRCRFPVQIVKAVRERVGEDFLIEVRVSGDERTPGGMKVEEMAVFCQMIDGIADIIHVSSGLYRDSVLTRTYSNYFDPHFVNLEQAAYIKAHTEHLLVSVVGGINDPEEADRLIGEGKIDLIALGRQALCDSDFPKKVIEGRSWDINRCVRCMSCMGGEAPPARTGEEADRRAKEQLDGEKMLDMLIDGTGPMHRTERCPVSPERDFIWPEGGFPEVTEPKRILVAGGGPAGLQAATTAAERGHHVTLVEKSMHLGGIMRYAYVDRFKADYKHHLELMLRRLGNSGAEVRLNTAADAELIRSLSPDVIIAAVGSGEKPSALPGAEHTVDILTMYHDCVIGSSAIVCGAGESGCEAAIWLADKGVAVTLISRSPMVMRTSGGGFRSIVEEQLEKHNVNVLLDTAVTAFGEGCAEIKKADGTTRKLEADTIVLAAGRSADEAALKEIREAAGEIPVLSIGDCVAPRKMYNAVAEGMQTALSIL